jgi:hypothetical protein
MPVTHAETCVIQAFYNDIRVSKSAIAGRKTPRVRFAARNEGVASNYPGNRVSRGADPWEHSFKPENGRMPRFTTIFRMIVMAIAAVIAVEGWQRYGPSTQQVKSLASRVLKIAHESLNKPELKPAETSGLVDNRPGDSPAFTAAPLTAPVVTAPVAQDGDFPAAPAIFAPVARAESIRTTSIEPPSSFESDADRLPALMNRLKELGGSEPQLVSWGSGGQLYRFCCQATLDDSPSFKRHFESVASEPSVAVEEVVAKVEAWRTEQDRSRLR